MTASERTISQRPSRHFGCPDSSVIQRTWPRFRNQMPHTNALSPPDDEYLCCLLRVPVLPLTSTCAASYEYLCCLLRVPVLPLTSTCCLPRPPQLRGPLKGVPEMLCRGLLCHSRFSFRLPLLCLSTTTRSSGGPKIGRGGVCAFHIPRNNFLQRTLCAKNRELPLEYLLLV